MTKKEEQELRDRALRIDMDNGRLWEKNRKLKSQNIDMFKRIEVLSKEVASGKNKVIGEYLKRIKEIEVIIDKAMESGDFNTPKEYAKEQKEIRFNLLRLTEVKNDRF